MSELDKITTTVPASSFVTPKEDPKKKIDDLERCLKDALNLSADEFDKVKEGMRMEKNKESNLEKIMTDLTFLIIDSGKPESDNSKQYAIYVQNKKVIKDLALNFFNVLKNYDVDTDRLPLLLLGTVIQFNYDRKKA